MEHLAVPEGAVYEMTPFSASNSIMFTFYVNKYVIMRTGCRAYNKGGIVFSTTILFFLFLIHNCFVIKLLSSTCEWFYLSNKPLIVMSFPFFRTYQRIFKMC